MDNQSVANMLYTVYHMVLT